MLKETPIMTKTAQELDESVVRAAKWRHVVRLDLAANATPDAHKRYELAGAELDNACELALARDESCEPPPDDDGALNPTDETASIASDLVAAMNGMGGVSGPAPFVGGVVRSGKIETVLLGAVGGGSLAGAGSGRGGFGSSPSGLDMNLYESRDTALHYTGHQSDLAVAVHGKGGNASGLPLGSESMCLEPPARSHPQGGGEHEGIDLELEDARTRLAEYFETYSELARLVTLPVSTESCEQIVACARRALSLLTQGTTP